jgi:hypothetical protein
MKNDGKYVASLMADTDKLIYSIGEDSIGNIHICASDGVYKLVQKNS